ncbi:ABC transporter permease [Pseudoduganella namucuonensis]|uniref:Simple sugar transport system permease protein n=1 Tax=Pseudoduganella namucuonensis TaxID=1035707 RepID=A0A1I7K8U1_9BURK|nr:ABC transporter permease [Pseudoduganella namucuonensis]SFU93837.1 simple sugar transport system permease protein [Pseudoduganella namucuonensis]
MSAFDQLAWGGAAAVLLAVLRAATPILFAALGGLVSELAGCVNVALEGIMLLAAFFGVMGAVYGQRWFPGLAPALYPWLGCAAGLLAALLLAGLLAVFHLELGADLIVAGIAVNLLAAGLTVFLLATLVGDKGSTAGINSPALPGLHIPGLSGWPLLDLLLNGESGQGHHVLLLAAPVTAALLAGWLARGRHGVWLRAVGENRGAALAAGIPVRRMQYAALLLSGLLAGLGGIYLSMGYLTLFQADMTAGRGFLALAAVFLGARRASGTLAAALLFGGASVLAMRLGALDWPTQLVAMLPPLTTLAALVLAGRMQSNKKTKE